MEIGNEWETLNLGAMLRQHRPGDWTNPEAMTAEVGFGLCRGTVKPLGVAEPDYFVGLITDSPWERLGSRNWWLAGWRLATIYLGEETVHVRGSGLALRVSEREDGFASAWYLRYRRDGGSMTVELYLPGGPASPTENDFLVQLDRETWQRSVNNHDGYSQVSVVVPVLDNLDSVSLLSGLPNFATNQLRAVEWLAVRALRIET